MDHTVALAFKSNRQVQSSALTIQKAEEETDEIRTVSTPRVVIESATEVLSTCQMRCTVLTSNRLRSEYQQGSQVGHRYILHRLGEEEQSQGNEGRGQLIR